MIFKTSDHQVYIYICASLAAQSVKTPPARQETQVGSLGWEATLKEEIAAHFSILIWETSWTEEPRGLQPMGSQRVRRDWAAKHCTAQYAYVNRKFLVYPSLFSPLVMISLLPMSVGAFLFCKQVHLCHILDSTSEWHHAVLVFLCLTTSSVWSSLLLLLLSCFSRVRLCVTP